MRTRTSRTASRLTAGLFLLVVTAVQSAERPVLSDGIRLSGTLRSDLKPTVDDKGGWSFRYAPDLRDNPMKWLAGDTVETDFRYKTWEQPERRYWQGLYGKGMKLQFEFPYPVTKLEASTLVANFADSEERSAFVDYSLDDVDYHVLAETTYGAEQKTFGGAVEIRHRDINRVWIRLRQGARDGNALHGGAIVFLEFALTFSGPARKLTVAQADAARERVVAPRKRREAEERSLLDAGGPQAEAVVLFNEALLAAEGTRRAWRYLAAASARGTKRDHVNARELRRGFREAESRLKALEDRFLVLYHAYGHSPPTARGEPAPVSEEAKRLMEDEAARTRELSGFLAQVEEVRARMATLVESVRLQSSELLRRAKRCRYAKRFRPTPRFEDKPSATIRADGTTTGIVYGTPFELDTRPALKPLGIDCLSGVYEKYDTDHKVSPVKRAAEAGRTAQVIVPCAVAGNSYCDPQWFLENRDKPITRVSAPEQYNGMWMWSLDFYHPLVRDMLKGYLTGIGERYLDDPRVAMYTTAWEARLCERGGTWGKWTSGGRTAAANEAFRAYLQDKFGTIADLNEAWGSGYEAFGAVKPPVDVHNGPQPERGKLVAALTSGACPPLYYEYNRFLLDSYADYFAWCYRVLKDADPNTPVSVSPSYGLLDGYLCNARDSFLWAEKACDLYGSEIHSPMEEVFHYSIQRLLNRTTGIFEYIWNGPENWSNPSEDVTRAAAQRNLWQLVGFGRSVIGLFGPQDTYGGKSYNNMLVYESGYHLLRPSAGVVGAMKRRLRSMEDVWFGAPVVEPKIAMLKPSTSQICAWPWEIVTTISQNLHSVLHGGNYHYAFVPEEYVLDGRDSLDRYTVLVLPYATHFPPGLTEKVLPWVEDGGTLITSGIAGGFTQHGRRDGALMKALFGQFSYASWFIDGVGGDHKWQLGIDELRPQVRDVGSNVAEILLAEYGEGKALLVARPDDLRPGGEAVPVMRELLDAAAPRVAWFDGGEVSMVARQGATRMHLVVVNPSSSKPVAGEVWLRAPCRGAVDRGIEGGFPIPLRKHAATKSFPLTLAPGVGTLVELTL